MRYDLEFNDGAEASEYLAALSFTALPGKPLYSHAAHGYDDDGRAIVTFARKCYSQLGNPVRWQFAEQAIRTPSRQHNFRD